MRISDLVTQLKPRVQRLGLVDPQTGYFDEEEVTEYCRIAMRYLANRYQLQHFVRINRELFRTVDGVESYALPANYGFIAPDDTRRSGLAVADSDGTNPHDLVYYDVARFTLVRSATENRPAWFTVADSLIYLGPIPDTTYIIEAIERPVQDGETLPEQYAQAIGIETLWRLASDQEKVTPALANERRETLQTIVNNESRARQKFYTSRERIGLGTRSGRAGGV